MTNPKKWQRVDQATAIYALADPRTGIVRYVGKTTQKTRSRLATHIAQAKNYHKHDRRYWILHWVRGLVSEGLRPEIFELEIVPAGDDWAEAEVFWIDVMRAWGFDLCNVRGGGQAGNFAKQSAETIERRVSKLRGRPGRKLTEAQKATAREHLALGRANRVWTQAQRKAQSERARQQAIINPRPKASASPRSRALVVGDQTFGSIVEAMAGLRVCKKTVHNWLNAGRASYVADKPQHAMEFS